MKRITKLLFHRVVLVSLCILAQLASILLGVLWFRSLTPWFSYLLTGISILVILGILSDRTNIAYKLAWIVPILAIPVFGLILYLIFGGNRLSARLKRKMSGMESILHRGLHPSEADNRRLAEQSPDVAVQSRYLTEQGFPVYANTQTQYFSDGRACWEVMLQELKKAKHTIYLEYYILQPGTMWDTVLKILVKKLQAGVDVRLIYDDFGCIPKLPENYLKYLRGLGLKVEVFNPYIPLLSSRLNNRDHRKLMIIDGVTAFTGGINMADEYINEGKCPLGHWKDCGILLRGDAVWSMTVIFRSMWNYLTDTNYLDPQPELPACEDYHGYVQPFTDSPLDFETVSRDVFLNLIHRAQTSLYIMTPYLIIDDTAAEALSIAAKSGIDVRIVTPGVADHAYVHATTRANYARLLEAGCRIYEYTPGFVHSKLILADNELAVVGTINLDFRSLYLNFENGIWLWDADCVGDIAQDFAQTFCRSKQVTLAEATNIRWYQKLLRAVLRVFSPLL